MWRPTLLSLSAASLAWINADAQRAVTLDNPSLHELVSKASAYVSRYDEVMSRLTADEHYVQELVAARVMSPLPSAGSSAQSRAIGGQQRTLRSECLLLRVGPPFEWRFYRNVLEVDGVPIKDRMTRLVDLLQQPTGTAVLAAERIAEESARYNIGDVGRVLNEPGLPFAFLRSAGRPAVEFSVDRRDGTLWVVAFTERRRPTLFRHNRTQDNPSSGRFWIDATGEIHRAEHVVSPFPIRATFTTFFRRDNRFDVAVPHELREQLTTGPAASARRVTGVATYTNYRQFEVTAEGNPRAAPESPASSAR